MKPSARILIIGSGNPCRNPRLAKEASALGHAGFDVTLLTPGGSLDLDALDRELTSSAPYRHEIVPPGGNRCTIFLQKLRHWLARRAVPHRVETVMALGIVSPLARRARALPADLTIVHNEIPFWIGCQLLRQGRRVAADFEDWYSEDLLPEDRLNRPLRLLRRIEAGLMRHAAYKTTTSAALSRALVQRYGGDAPHVISNAFPLQPDPRTGAPGDPPVFFWFSQTLGPGRGLELFQAAWLRTTRPSRLVLLGESRSDYHRQFLARLPDDFRGRVSFLPLVPPAELPALIARHDIGLALEQSSIPNRDLTVTNKILQYFNAGLAVVASQTAGQQEVFARAPGAGLMVTLAQTDEVARQLDALLADRARLASMGTAARRAAENIYCWEKEAPRLVTIVEAV
ncbi:MAG TPA: glycosyltransferase [Opitutaceae bacterium]|jgi:glycosyltransferase involved in cell wall biosynthesis|nr:glycosyltransferase [Opitutaceae bacterium]